MDQIDRDLIALLREDSSRPLKALGAAVGLSASGVRERIARLRDTGAIRRFTIETPPQAEGVGAVLSIRLAATPDPIAVAAICAKPEVARCYSLSGAVDLLVELAAANVEALNRARDAIALIQGVATVETALVLKREKAPA